MLTLVIQAGGKSTRMGQDKALMPFLGKPLIQRVIERLASTADEVLVTTNNPDDYEFLDLPCFEDLIPDRGALGGLYTALSAANYPLVAVVGCDMPFASAGIIDYCRQLLDESGADVAIPDSDSGLEPMHAVYRKGTCLPAIQAAIDADKWKLIAFHHAVEVLTISPMEMLQYDPNKRAFLNVNKPEEFTQAEMWARQDSM